MPTSNWAVEHEAKAGTRPFDAWICLIRPGVWVRLVATFLSSHSHLNALRIHQLEQEKSIGSVLLKIQVKLFKDLLLGQNLMGFQTLVSNSVLVPEPGCALDRLRLLAREFIL